MTAGIRRSPSICQRVRKKDEDYWDQYRAAPKAIITVRDAQRLWGSRYGKVSSFCVCPAMLQIGAQAHRSGRRRIHRAASCALTPLLAAQGTTDFGEYFLYFSFFLVVSALLLAYLFFAVGLEQRTTEVGVLASIGFSPRRFAACSCARARSSRRSAPRSAPLAAIGYSALILYGLRTWWVGAVGTTELGLHVAPQWLAIGVDRRAGPSDWWRCGLAFAR